MACKLLFRVYNQLCLYGITTKNLSNFFTNVLSANLFEIYSHVRQKEKQIRAENSLTDGGKNVMMLNTKHSFC